MIAAVAIGIGANAAVFSLVNEVMLRELPGSHAGEVRIVGLKSMEWNWFYPLPGEVGHRILQDSSLHEDAAMATSVWVTVTGWEDPKRLEGLRVTEGFFGVLGLNAHAGRLFDRADYDPAPAPVMILGYRFWQESFAGDPEVIGSDLVVNGQLRTVIGILPPGVVFQGLEAGLWVPSTLREPNYIGSYESGFPVAFRPSDDMSEKALVAAVESMYTQWCSENGAEPDESEVAIKRVSEVDGDWEKQQLGILLGIVLLILLIAVFNTINLLLSHAWTRRGETAIRTALGASPRKLVRQSLGENAILAGLGSVAGLFLGKALLAWLSTAFSGARWGVLRYLHGEVEMDVPVMLVTGAVSVLVILALSMGPVLVALKIPLASLLKEGGRTSSGNRVFQTVRKAILVIEVALSTFLLAIAFLFIQDMRQIAGFDSGFGTDHILYTKIDLPFYDYPTRNDPVLTRKFEQIAERIRAMPEVESVTYGHIPTWAGRAAFRVVDIHPSDITIEEAPVARKLNVGTDYFRTFGIGWVMGRDFDARDMDPRAEPVAVVTRRFVEKYLQGRTPLGQYVEVDQWHGLGFSNPIRIVGVCESLERYWTDEQRGQIFLPHGKQLETFFANVYVKSPISLGSLHEPILKTAHMVEPDAVLEPVKTVDDFMRDAASTPRFIGAMQMLFGIISATLAAVGIVGVISYSVSQRMREMGIRQAMGATPARIRRLILGEAAGLVLLGIVLGIAGALSCVRYLEDHLSLVEIHAPSTYLLVGGFVFLIGMLSALRPARRAASARPADLLRDA